MELLVKPEMLTSYIQGVTGGKDLTSGECSLGQTIPTTQNTYIQSSMVTEILNIEK